MFLNAGADPRFCQKGLMYIVKMCKAGVHPHTVSLFLCWLDMGKWERSRQQGGLPGSTPVLLYVCFCSNNAFDFYSLKIRSIPI